MRKLVYIKIDDSFLAASINYLFIFFSLQLLQAGIRFKVSTANSVRLEILSEKSFPKLVSLYTSKGFL